MIEEAKENKFRKEARPILRGTGGASYRGPKALASGAIQSPFGLRDVGTMPDRLFVHPKK